MTPQQKVKSTMQALLRKGASFLTPAPTPPPEANISTAAEGTLFPTVDPAVDGEECLHDCSTCTIQYPRKWNIDETDKLYGHVKGWSTHLLVATGKTDWVRDVADEKGSVMEAVGKAPKPDNGRLMLSASDIPLPDLDPSSAAHTTPLDPSHVPTTCILLPAFVTISNVTPTSVPDLLRSIVSTAPTTTTPISSKHSLPPSKSMISLPSMTPESNSMIPSSDATPPSMAPSIHQFHIAPCPHRALILLCSQKTRDARCGQSAPLLRREFERHLRPLGMYRDLHDQRPGGVGIYFISHVGGHKFAANVMVYRRGGFDTADKEINGAMEKLSLHGNETNGVVPEDEGDEGEGVHVIGTAVENGDGGVAAAEHGATQGIWLARVRPEDCEGIIKYTVLQGKVVKPQWQLRGGFDRGRGVISW